MTTKEWKALFDRVNRVCAESGESVVPYADINYYATQVDNLTGNKDPDAAFEVAVELCRMEILR